MQSSLCFACFLFLSFPSLIPICFAGAGQDFLFSLSVQFFTPETLLLHYWLESLKPSSCCQKKLRKEEVLFCLFSICIRGMTKPLRSLVLSCLFSICIRGTTSPLRSLFLPIFYFHKRYDQTLSYSC
jgi:hypothetical protein